MRRAETRNCRNQPICLSQALATALLNRDRVRGAHGQAGEWTVKHLKKGDRSEGGRHVELPTCDCRVGREGEEDDERWRDRP